MVERVWMTSGLLLLVTLSFLGGMDAGGLGRIATKEVFQETTEDPLWMCERECCGYYCPQTTPPPCECETCEPCTIPTCPPPVTCEPFTPPPPPTCQTCEPCYPETCPPPVTSEPCPTCAPSGGGSCGPKFRKTLYESSVPSWPTAGTQLDLGIEASSSSGEAVVYTLVDPPSYITLGSNLNILFTANIAEGAFVGPNNVMLLQITAHSYDEPSSLDTAVIAIVFPRPTLLHLDD